MWCFKQQAQIVMSLACGWAVLKSEHVSTLQLSRDQLALLHLDQLEEMDYSFSGVTNWEAGGRSVMPLDLIIHA